MKALICGVTGQDGSLLAKYLIEKNYEVIGTSRDSSVSSFRNLKYLNIYDQVTKISMALNDFRRVFEVVKSHRPNEIYN